MWEMSYIDLYNSVSFLKEPINGYSLLDYTNNINKIERKGELESISSPTSLITKDINSINLDYVNAKNSEYLSINR